jgi:hypothetical protein
MGSLTLQTLQDPILLLPWLSFRGGGFPNPKGEAWAAHASTRDTQITPKLFFLLAQVHP